MQKMGATLLKLARGVQRLVHVSHLDGEEEGEWEEDDDRDKRDCSKDVKAGSVTGYFDVSI